MGICIHCEHYEKQISQACHNPGEILHLCTYEDFLPDMTIDHITGETYRPRFTSCLKHNANGECPEYATGIDVGSLTDKNLKECMEYVNTVRFGKEIPDATVNGLDSPYIDDRPEPSMTSKHIAARIWCDPDMAHEEVDAVAALEIARVLDRCRK